MISSTQDRVLKHSAEWITRRNRRQIEATLVYYTQRLDEIQQRLDELDAEWDIERAIEAQSSAMIFVGTALGLLWRRWRLVPALVSGFLFQHAMQGWCPPVPLFRRLGLRTAAEICQERCALKALRGDFRAVPETHDNPGQSARAAIDAAE